MTSTNMLKLGGLSLVLSVGLWLLLAVAPGEATFVLLLVLSLLAAAAGLVLLTVGCIAKVIAVGVREGGKR